MAVEQPATHPQLETCFLSIPCLWPMQVTVDTDSGLMGRWETQHPPGDVEGAG